MPEKPVLPQLIMRWQNDHIEKHEPKLPDGCALEAFPDTDNAVDVWLDIVQYGLSEGLMDAGFYKSIMSDYPNYSEDKCFFVKYNGEYAATFAVICDYEKKDGYIHMVACKEAFRGIGIGNFMSAYADYVLRKEGMETAHLTTDDWRISAIKSYLRYGFAPDTISHESFKDRWDKIYKIIK